MAQCAFTFITSTIFFFVASHFFFSYRMVAMCNQSGYEIYAILRGRIYLWKFADQPESWCKSHLLVQFLPVKTYSCNFTASRIEISARIIILHVEICEQKDLKVDLFCWKGVISRFLLLMVSFYASGYHKPAGKKRGVEGKSRQMSQRMKGALRIQSTTII